MDRWSRPRWSASTYWAALTDLKPRISARSFWVKLCFSRSCLILFPKCSYVVKYGDDLGGVFSLAKRVSYSVEVKMQMGLDTITATLSMVKLLRLWYTPCSSIHRRYKQKWDTDNVSHFAKRYTNIQARFAYVWRLFFYQFTVADPNKPLYPKRINQFLIC